MRSRWRSLCGAILLLALAGAEMISPAQAETRTFEFKFQLSAGSGSEFSAKLPVFKPGPFTVQAEWRSLTAPTETATKLTLVLLRPNNTEAARTSGVSPLRFEIHVTEQDIGRLDDRGQSRWTLRIINSASEDRREVAGTLKASLPVIGGTLADTDFTLLGAGNAQEVPFTISSPGRVVLEARWDGGIPGGNMSEPPLIISLTHLAQSRTYARRFGKSPLRVEQLVTERETEVGLRWVVRLQNDGPAKVKGVLKITFIPES